jgi:phospholipid-binding lipoprotein MlaA
MGLTACAHTNVPSNPIDPFEPINRQIFQFNMDVDKVFFKPIATAYQKVTPWPIRVGIYNFFENLDVIPNFINDVLQVNPLQAMSDGWRFAINTAFGIGGLVDVATPLGLKKNTQNFGLTLARWGWKQSAYVVLPIYGPSTVRNAIGSELNYQFLTVFPHIKWRVRYPLLGVWALSYRTNLLGVDDMATQAAVDPYVFFRDAYLQQQQNLISQNDATGFDARTSSTITKTDTATNKKSNDADADLINSIGGELPRP